MKKYTLKRTYFKDRTLGFLKVEKEVFCTLELPDLNNQNDISCIPPGEYICKNNHNSPSQGNCISIKNVKNRTDILMHVANFIHDILGCIAIGEEFKKIDKGHFGVTNSKKSLKKLMSLLPGEFILVIE